VRAAATSSASSTSSSSMSERVYVGFMVAAFMCLPPPLRLSLLRWRVGSADNLVGIPVGESIGIEEPSELSSSTAPVPVEILVGACVGESVTALLLLILFGVGDNVGTEVVDTGVVGAGVVGKSVGEEVGSEVNPLPSSSSSSTVGSAVVGTWVGKSVVGASVGSLVSRGAARTRSVVVSESIVISESTALARVGEKVRGVGD